MDRINPKSLPSATGLNEQHGIGLWTFRDTRRGFQNIDEIV